MITGLRWTWLPLPGLIRTRTQPHGLASALLRHHGDRAGAAPVCLAGAVGQALAARPCPASPVGTRRGPNSVKKEEIHSVHYQPGSFKHNTPQKVLLGLLLPPHTL